MPSGSHTVSPELWQTTKAVRGTEPGQYRGDTGPWKEQWEGLQRASSICPELEDSTGHLSEQVTTRPMLVALQIFVFFLYFLCFLQFSLSTE